MLARGGSPPRPTAITPGHMRCRPLHSRAPRPCLVAVGRDAWPPGLPARAAAPSARCAAWLPVRPTRVRSRAPLAPHSRRALARGGSPPRCAAWQVAHAESFACRDLPAGAPRPRHGARQGRAPGAMLGPRASRLAPPLPTRITRAARFAAWHLAPPVAPPKSAPPKRPCQKRRIVKYLRCYARHFRQQSTYRTPCRSTVMG